MNEAPQVAGGPDDEPIEEPPHGALVFSDATFESLGVEGPILKSLDRAGFKKATEVQKRTFQAVHAGKDVLVQSKTGSGKTGAFGIPLLQRMSAHDGDRRPRVLVLCPTRELASQVEREIGMLGEDKGFRSIAIYGGVGFGKQNEALARGVDVVVGTPGRIMDQIEQKNLDLSRVQALVLDEADEMLSMGFWEDVMWIIKKLPKERQTLLFSATLPFTIERAARSFLKEPERIDLSAGEQMSAEGITHAMYLSDQKLPKPRNLLYLMEVERPESCIIFCNTRSDVDIIHKYLGNLGYDIEALSGDLSQAQREKVLGAIKLGKLRMMVATDVAARGIDIRNLSHVIMYSLPEDPEVYIHRSGRTGRIGKKGTAISLIGGGEEQTRSVLRRDFGVNLELRTLPDHHVIAQMRSERILKQLLEQAEQAEVSQHMHTAETILKSEKAGTVVAYLLKQFLSKASRPSLLEGGDAPQRMAEPSHRHKEDRAPKPHAERAPPKPRREEEAPQDDRRPKKLFVGIGEAENVDAGAVVELLSGLAGVGKDAFSDVEVRRTATFLRVNDDAFDAVLALNGKDHNGKPLLVERARRR
ncbi:MAG: DEAD/DEAH box helicase [Deltaproteobacteria bacterium]|nr:DEAD/DEAH box helicase [Deltaproteobacteria bacterium]